MRLRDEPCNPQGQLCVGSIVADRLVSRRKVPGVQLIKRHLLRLTGLVRCTVFHMQ